MAALCSSSYNPLTQFAKHRHEDRGLQRDRLVSRKNDVGRQGFRSGRNGNHNQMAINFAEFNQPHIQLPIQDSSSQQSLFGRGEALSFGSDRLGSNWSLEFNSSDFKSRRGLQQMNYNSNYIPKTSNRSRKQANAQVRQANPLSGYGVTNPVGVRLTPIGPSSMLGLDQQSRIQEEPFEGLDWEAVFDQLEQVGNAAESDLIVVSGGSGNYSFAMNEHESFDATSNGVVSTEQTAGKISFDKAEGYTSGQFTEQTMTTDIRSQPQLLTTPTTDYRFQEDNPFGESPNSFEEGMDIIRNDGNLSFAVLAFEAACQKEPDHVDAWRMLGSVQSENEQETAAIKALREALRLDPTSLDVVMKLAISYTNEGTVSLAHEYLEKWLGSKYPEIPIAEFEPTNYFPNFSQSLERIKAAFIGAAQLSVCSDNVDPDVQVGLGVLLFSAQHYQMAADCFASAIQTTAPGTTNTQSQLHLLWNRYGACLGNMKQHEAGIEAYEMALAIRPNFVRARYNLGLLYYNKNEPLSGAKYTLQALVARKAAESKARTDMLRIVKVGTSHGKLEEIIRRDEPTSIYETLRRCCGSLCRWDLVDVVGPGMDIQAFQKELDRL